MNQGFQTGDVVLIWGKSLDAKFVSCVVSTLFGIKNPATHVQLAMDSKLDLSAEMKGIQLVNREISIKKAKKVIIARHAGMSKEKREELASISKQYIGKPYDYFLYILWYMRVSLLFAPLVWLILQPYHNWLKQRARKSYSCSELVSEILNKVGFSFGIDDHTNAAPSDIYQVVKACEEWKIIFEKEEAKNENSRSKKKVREKPA